MTYTIYEKIIDNTILTLCSFKYYLSQSIIAIDQLFKIEYLKRLLKCYHIIMNRSNDNGLDVELYLTLTNRNRVFDLDESNNTDLQQHLETVRKRYVAISNLKEYTINNVD